MLVGPWSGNGRVRGRTCEWTTQHFACRCGDYGGHWRVLLRCLPLQGRLPVLVHLLAKCWVVCSRPQFVDPATSQTILLVAHHLNRAWDSLTGSLLLYVMLEEQVEVNECMSSSQVGNHISKLVRHYTSTSYGALILLDTPPPPCPALEGPTISAPGTSHYVISSFYFSVPVSPTCN